MMDRGSQFLLVGASILAHLLVICARETQDTITVTYSIEKRWYGGFLGRFHLNFTEDADYWLFDVTFKKNIYDLRTYGSVAKVGRQSHRYYRFADLPWSRHVHRGDTAEVLFYAKTFRKVRGLTATITRVKAYPSRPCIRSCDDSNSEIALYDKWRQRTCYVRQNYGKDGYTFNDYVTVVVSGQGASASASISGGFVLEGVNQIMTYNLYEFTYRSVKKMPHLGPLGFETAFAFPSSGAVVFYVSGAEACSCFAANRPL